MVIILCVTLFCSLAFSFILLLALVQTKKEKKNYLLSPNEVRSFDMIVSVIRDHFFIALVDGKWTTPNAETVYKLLQSFDAKFSAEQNYLVLQLLVQILIASNFQVSAKINTVLQPSVN